MPISKWLALAFCVFSSVTWAQDFKPGKVTQTPGTIAWPWPGAGMIVVPNNLLVTNVLTFTLTAQVTPASINRFGIQWQTNGPQPGTVVFTPDNQASTVVTLGSAGTYNLSATVSDGAKVVLNQFTVVANAIQNQAPTITTPSNVAINENTSSGSILFTVGDAETAPGALSVNAVSSNPTLISGAGLALGGAGANRTIDLTPSNNQHGTATITLTVSDGGTPTMSASSSFLLTVSAVNIPPTFTSVPNPVLMNEDVPGSFTVGVDDLDTPLSLLTLTATSTATFISSLVTSGSGASRSVAVGLVSNAFGSGTITLGLTDGQNPITTTTTITVASVNDPPTISPIGPLQTLIGNAISADFTVNDVEDGGNLVVSAATDNPAVLPLANISLTGTGTNRTITVTPIAQGVANVTVTATDTLGSPATRILVVTSSQTPNTAPSITGPGNQVIAEGGVLNISIPIADAETAPSLLVLSGQSSNQDLLPDGNLILGGTGSTRSLAATPVAFSNGVTTITLILQDTGGLTDTNTFTLTVTPVNDCPVSPQISAQSTLEDTPKLVSFSVIDHDGDVLTITGTSSNAGLVSNDPAHITFGGAGESRTVTLSPLLNQTGQTTIAVKIDDGTCAVTNSFLLTVAPTNDPPTISGIAAQTFAEDTTNIVSFTISDPETPANLLTLSVTSSDATLTPASAFTFVGSGSARGLKILPATNQSGTALIVVSVSDGTNSISSAYSITVTPVNDAPTIQSLGNQTLPQGAASMTVNFSVADVDSALGGLTLSATTSTPSVLPLSGIVFGGAGGSRSVTFTPIAAGFSTVTLSVSDGSLTSTTPPFTVTMPGPINNLPTITGPADQSVFKSQPTAALPVTVSDAETPAASLILTAATSNPALAPLSGISLGGSGSARTVAVTPVINQVGTATITLSVQDGAGSVANTSFVLSVLATNYPPTISSVTSPQNVAENSSINIAITIGDPDTSLSSLTLSGVSGDTTLVPNANIVFTGAGASRTATITPAVNRYGTNTISLRVSDGTTTSSTTFSLQVTFKNQLPTITGLPSTLTLDFNTPSSALPFTIGDVETPASNLTLSSQIGNPSLIASAVFGGSGTSRTVMITPVTGQSGSTTVRVVVTDSNNESSSQTMSVVVNQQQVIPTSGFFISTTGGTGAGTNAATAWSLDYVASGQVQSDGKLPAGQTNVITVLPGTYTHTVNGHTTGWRFNTHGTTAFPIIIKGLNYPYDSSPSILDMQDGRNEGAGGIEGILADNASYTWFVDLQVKNTAPKPFNRDRNSLQTMALCRADKGEGIKFIGLAMTDGGNNFRFQRDIVVAHGVEANGCMSRYAGWAEYDSGIFNDTGWGSPGPSGQPNHGAGWGCYGQNQPGSDVRRIINCIHAEDAAGGTEINGTDPDGPSYNFYLLGNAYIYPGGSCLGATLNHVGTTMFIMGDFHESTNLVGGSCIGWIPKDNASGGGGVSYGHSGTPVIHHLNKLTNNFIVGNLNSFIDQNQSLFQDNTFVSFHYPPVNWAPSGNNLGAGSGNIFNRNAYYVLGGGVPWRIHNNDATLSPVNQVNSQLGFEAQAIYNGTAPPPTNTVVLRRFDYDARRATLTIINWSHANTVPVNFSTDITGKSFAADGKNWKAIWVLNYSTAYTSGTKMGTVNFPMNGSTAIEQPTGPGLGPGVNTLPECWAGIIILTN